MPPAPSPFSPWWHPDRHADRRAFLVARAAIKSAIRTWFAELGFIEVEPGCLQVSPGNEAHLHAMRTDVIGPDLNVRVRYLNTSPEYAMKKLLAAGETRIFSFTPCFRNRERGALHAPEFTMLEWYRAHAPYESVMEDAAHLLRLACQTTEQRLVSWRDATCDPMEGPERVTVAQAFRRYAGVDLLGSLSEPGGSRAALAAMAEGAGLRVRDSDTWSDIFARILAAFVEPRLGVARPTILYEYPACQAALARSKLGDPRVAERFELYAAGVELANGFGELTDPARQRANLEAQMNLKEAVYGERYPIDEEFLEALALMPPASGCALGFDRLVLLAAGATDIDQVLWTPPV